MSRYVVIGAGAVGATVAAELHEAGRDVLLIARGRHLEILRERGLDYVRPDGVHRIVLPVASGPDDVALTADDILVLATKSQDSEAALAQWAWQPVGDGQTSAASVLPIVLLQNGLDNVRTALRRFATVIDSAVLIPAAYLTPGEVLSPAAPAVGAVFFGLAPSGTDAIVEAIAADFRATRWEVGVVPDIAAFKAGKLLGNLAHNLDALYRPSARRDAASEALRDEARAVYAAAGIKIAELSGHGIDLRAVSSQPIEGYARGGSSTWQSLARAVPNESDFLNGEIALLGRLHGIPTPYNAAVQARIARAAREGTVPGSLGDDDLASTFGGLGRPAVLIGAAALDDELASDRPPAVLDVRWALGDPDGRKHYESAHIPGAVYVDLDTELASHGVPTSGRHPLPDIESLQAAARRWGLTEGRPVVVYDNVGGLSAARAWWLLRWAGVPDVRILDGALAGWTADGFDVESGAQTPPPGDVTLTGGHLPTLTADEAAALAHGGILLDARAAERYRGDVEPIDPRAGHIPGAISAPTGENLGANGHFRDAADLRTRFAQLGAIDVGSVGVYCGSGVTAAHEIAALAIAGIDAALYPGSWSAWSSDPERPIATGSQPNQSAGD